MKTLNVGNRSLSAGRLAAAAGVAVAMLAAASPARAQFRVGADGHFNDVNNRIGSGGYNSPSDASYRSALNNQIITGNVSGLGYFHGGSQDFDNNVFQGGTRDSAFDNFNAIAAPVNTQARSTGASPYTPYYSTNNYVGQTPPNLVPTANNVGYIPAPTRSGLTPNPADVRLQNLNQSPLDLNGNNLPPPGAVNQPGPVNNVGDPGLYSQSSLYGVRQMQPGDATQDNVFSERYGNIGRPGAGPRMDASAIQQMRNELAVQPVGQQKGNGKDQTPGQDSRDANDPSVSSKADTLGQPINPNTVTGTTPTGSAMGNSAVVNAQRVPSSIDTPYSTQQNNLLIPANQQSAQIRELQRRFAANNPHPDVVAQANETNRLRLAMRRQQADAKIAAAKGADDNAKPPALGGTGGLDGLGAGSPPAGGGGAVASANVHPQPNGKSDLPSVIRDPAAAEPMGDPDKPFTIASLATGIKSPGLANLLRTAEGQMRSGQFGQSVDTYDTAAEVAPNNPFVPLGRGFAELGASYYGKAEMDLTRAILTEPALLAAQYDLKGFLGADRLKFVQKDLADIGATEQTARPYLLLAYLDHNTGADDATVTAKDLDTAQARGGNPKLIDLMREAWNLKAAAK